MAVNFYDYNAILTRVKARLLAKSEHADIIYSGVNARVLEALSEEWGFINQYLEYAVRENYWSLARNRSSLLAESPVHGFVVPRKVGAEGYVRISASEVFTAPPINNVPIPKWSQFSNGGDIAVVVKGSAILSTFDNYLDIPVIQGTKQEVSFIALGNNFETKDIVDDSVENSFYELYVNGVLWTKVNTLFEYTGSDLVYEINTSPDFSKVTLKFGNDTFGKKLVTSDSVQFFYTQTLGSTGNITSTGIINRSDTIFYDIYGNVTDIFVNNLITIAGGRDELTLEEIRELSPQVFQSGDRATTSDDYKVILGQIPSIAKKNVWGAYEYFIDNNLDPWDYISPQENVVHLAILMSGYLPPTDQQKTDIIATLNPKKGTTDLISFEDVEIVNLDFVIDAFVLNTSYTLTEVRTTIDTALQDNYAISNMEFNVNVYNSDLQRLIDELSGVKYHDSYMKSHKLFEFSEAYVSNLDLPIYPVQGDTVEIRLKLKTAPDTAYTLIGTCNNSGIVTGEPGYNLGTSEIDLSTGEGFIIVLSGITGDYDDYDIRIDYQGQSVNYILNKRNFIFSLSERTITCQYAR
jgi:hypothetical protein